MLCGLCALLPAHSSQNCSAHPACASVGLQGKCCPDASGLVLTCCRLSTLSVDNTSLTEGNTSSPTVQPSNTKPQTGCIEGVRDSQGRCRENRTPARYYFAWNFLLVMWSLFVAGLCVMIARLPATLLVRAAGAGEDTVNPGMSIRFQRMYCGAWLHPTLELHLSL